MEHLWHFLQASGPVIRSVLSHVWEWIHPAFEAAFVAISIAIMGLFVSWKQLQYMQKRDEALDIRNSWAETHKLMTSFLFKRALYKTNLVGSATRGDSAIAAKEALYILTAQLNQMPDSVLVEQIADFLHANEATDNWMSVEFVKPFEEYSRQAALLARPSTTRQ